MRKMTRLPVGASDQISPLGTARLLLQVACPKKARTVQLETCCECSACRGFDDGEATGARPSVLCQP